MAKWKIGNADSESKGGEMLSMPLGSDWVLALPFPNKVEKKEKINCLGSSQSC
jgi:hypothetical protein